MSFDAVTLNFVLYKMLKSVRGVAFTADAVSLTPSFKEQRNTSPPRCGVYRSLLSLWVDRDWEMAPRRRHPVQESSDISWFTDGLLFLHSIYKDIHLVNALVEPGDSYPEADTYLNHDGDKMTMMACISKDCSIEGDGGKLLKLIGVLAQVV